MAMPGDLLSLIEIAADLREKRVTAWELTEAAIGRHERFGERLHAYSLWAPVQARAAAQAADAAFAGGVSVGARFDPFRTVASARMKSGCVSSSFGRRLPTLVFLLYQKGRDSRIFQAQDRAIDDFTFEYCSH
jgi:hypothetical protein